MLSCNFNDCTLTVLVVFGINWMAITAPAPIERACKQMQAVKGMALTQI
jgi:hypothetical protein